MSTVESLLSAAIVAPIHPAGSTGNASEPEDDTALSASLKWTIGFDDVLERQDPTPYLVDGLLHYPSLSIVYGAPGSLKSMLMADLAACVAGGKRWLEQMPLDDGKPGVTLSTTQAPVLWVDYDNGRRETRARIGAVRRAHGLIAPGIPFGYASLQEPRLDGGNKEMMRYFTALVRQGSFRLIFVDNLGQVSGGTEENSAKMSDVLNGFRYLAEEANCAVVLLHHQRKSGSTAGGADIRKGETMRGSSAIEAALDLALLVERVPGSDTVLMTPTKVRKAIRFAEASARFTYDHYEGSLDLERARFFSLAVGNTDRSTELLRALILQCVKAAPGINGTALAKEVTEDASETPGFGKVPTEKRVRAVAKKMVADGLLTATTGTSNQRNYCAV